MAEDTEHRAARAMRFETTFAESADGMNSTGSAGDIDFADHTAADPQVFPCAGASDFRDLSDKFVSRSAPKTVVTTENFDIGLADACKANSYSRPAWAQTRQRLFFAD
jgi:hypothetical protein